MKLPAFILIALLILFSCKSSKDSTVSSKTAITTKSDEPDKIKQSSAEEPVNDKIYRLYVSFFSRGPGIDRKAKIAFDNFIIKYESDNNLKIEYEAIKWGREGEIDYCFQLNNLSKKQQGKFITETRKILETSKLVHIRENAECVYKKGKK